MPQYFTLSIYIFAKFANFFLYPLLAKILLFDINRKELFIDILLNKLLDLLIKSMEGDKMRNKISKKNIIKVFLSLKLI